MARVNEEVFWGDAASWLNTVARNQQEVQFDYDMSDGVETFALKLQNGVVLCDLLNLLHSGATASIIRGEKLKSYQCAQNAKAFLYGCVMVFQWPLESMFAPDDLYDGSRFERVVQTLSRLSHTKQAASLRIADLQPFPEAQIKEFVPVDEDSQEESIYTNVTKAIASNRRRQRTSSNQSNPIPSFEAGPVGALEEEYADAMKLLDNLYDDAADIYDSIVHSRSVSDTISKPQEQDMRAAKGQRDQILNELLETEQGYISGLTAMLTSYLMKMQAPQMLKSMSITNLDIDTIFMNLASLIPLHEAVHRRIRQREDVGAVFTDTKTQFLQYAKFCTNLPEAHARLDTLMKKRDFKAQLESLQQGVPGRFDLKSMLCLPMQRILKYPLLLNDMLRHTPEGHPSRGSLESAVRAMKDIATYINEFSRDSDMIKSIAALEQNMKDYPLDYYGAGLIGFGRLLLDGEVKVKRAEEKSKMQKYHCFLFEKALAVTVSDRRHFVFKYAVELKHFQCNPSQHKGSNVALELTTQVPSLTAYNCTMVFKTGALQLEWAEVLSDAISRCSPLGIRPKKSKACSWDLSTFAEPTLCSICECLLSGLISQGYKCGGDNGMGCQKAIHRACIDMANPVCTSDKRSLRHSWAPPSQRRVVDVKRISVRRGYVGVSSDEPPQRGSGRRGSAIGHRRQGSGQSLDGRDDSSVGPKQGLDSTSDAIRGVSTRQEHVQRSGADTARGLLRQGSESSLDGIRSANKRQGSDSVKHGSEGGISFTAGSLRVSRPALRAAPAPNRPILNSQAGATGEHTVGDYINTDELGQLLDESGPPVALRSSSAQRESYVNIDFDATETHGDENENSYQNVDMDDNLAPMPPLRLWQQNPWYAGTLSRADAEAMFKNAKVGAFLVRESSREGRQGMYILDICVENGEVKHVPIERDKESGLYYISRRKKFISIPEVIAYYQNSSLISSFPAIPTKLVYAIGKKVHHESRGGRVQIENESRLFTDVSANFVTAIVNYESRGDRELSVRIGDSFTVQHEYEDGWLDVHTAGGRKGLVHKSFVQS